ncbi:imm11 family protein [Yoonia sp. R2-816]|uniref:imm11 family protein n=1 Tax=Yoonia sp. R2-816 TaxID=3342638 RepID=UPI00372C4728
MAITISGDHAHTPSKTVEAVPFGEEETAKYARFKEWKNQTESKHRVDWIISKAPKSEDRQLSFPYNADLVPKKMQLTNGSADWDYSGHVGIPNANAVGQKFKDVIESVEADVHQFLPFELYDQKGMLINKPFYFWRICTSIDAISPALGGVKPMTNSPHYLWQILRGEGRKKLAVRKDLIIGRAAWYDVRYKLPPFISDEVVGLLKAQELTGWTATDYWKEI